MSHGRIANGVDKPRHMKSSRAAPIFIGALALAITGPAFAGPCTGPGAPTTTQTKCLTAVAIPGHPLRSFDISWDNPDRAEYYLGDRSNAGIDIIDTHNNMFKRRLDGFVGVVLNPGPSPQTVNNSKSGPDGVTSHGKWLYGGDGNSTLRVYDLDAPTGHAFKQAVSTGGTTRVDEMALTTDGRLLLAANNAEDPPFATLFHANGDNFTSNVTIITKISVDPTIIPAGEGLSLEQPAWDPRTARFYVSVPQINSPAGCTPGTNCSGGLLIIDPTTLAHPNAVIGAFNPATNTGVLAINECGPNGITVGPHDNLLQGCTPANLKGTTSTLVINAMTKHFANIGGITGSDEVWFNPGDDRYYTGSSANPAALGGPSLGVINARSNLLVETIPQGSGSHSVAADLARNHIFVPQVAPVAVVGPGGDTTGVSAGICGTSNGCVAVYEHDVDHDHDMADNDDH